MSLQLRRAHTMESNPSEEITFGPVGTDEENAAGVPMRKLHRAIESRIRLHIENSRLQAGAQLPTEAQLCQQYQVSRSTIRNALKRLEADGLIVRTRGRGTFLRDPQSGLTAPAGRFIAGPPDSRAGRRATIGVVLSYASDYDVMQAAILRGIEHAIRPRGYTFLFARTDDCDEPGETRAITELHGYGIQGLICMPVSNRATTPGVSLLVERKTPVVLVDRYLTGLDTGYVVADNFTGAYRATEHLILLGYPSYEFVLSTSSGPAAEQLLTTSIRDRYLGFCQALRDYRLADRIRGPAFIDVNNAEAVCHLLSGRRKAGLASVAIVALNDMMAAAIMNSAARAGLRPPGDFAVTGFDDLPIASHLPVPLTTVIQPRYDIGFRAGHILVDQIEGHRVRADKLSLMVSLVVRESCGARRVARQHHAAPAPAPA
jgi:DNA-binding LacI/PurR family transcriptional regulator